MSSSSIIPPSPPAAFDPSPATLLSLAVALSLLPAAQLLAKLSLPASTTPRTHTYLFIWFAYDALTHFLLEGPFLYHCFASYLTLSPGETSPHPSLTPSHIHFLGREDRRYGSLYSSAPMARLWQEYAKADSRWGGADLTIIALELLTVFLAGPCAAYLAYLISGINHSATKSDSQGRGKKLARLWVLGIMLSTGELYGGFMTFAPEWLSGNGSLYTADPVYLWGYLVFANVIWVFVPVWVIYVGWREVGRAFEGRGGESAGKKGQ